jgi:hypothetical protein
VIAHVVLFQPKGNLPDGERSALADALGAALREIPSIRRSRVGRRVTHGRPYEQLMREHYEYIAVLEFDDLAGLKAYLEHPAHEALARRFFDALESALMYDYEMNEGEAGLDALR